MKRRIKQQTLWNLLHQSTYLCKYIFMYATFSYSSIVKREITWNPRNAEVYQGGMSSIEYRRELWFDFFALTSSKSSAFSWSFSTSLSYTNLSVNKNQNYAYLFRFLHTFNTCLYSVPQVPIWICQNNTSKYDLPWFCSVVLAMKWLFDWDKMLINTCMCKELHFLPAMSRLIF